MSQHLHLYGNGGIVAEGIYHFDASPILVPHKLHSHLH
jgi:hypothetical protein